MYLLVAVALRPGSAPSSPGSSKTLISAQSMPNKDTADLVPVLILALIGCHLISSKFCQLWNKYRGQNENLKRASNRKPSVSLSVQRVPCEQRGCRASAWPPLAPHSLSGQQLFEVFTPLNLWGQGDICTWRNWGAGVQGPPAGPTLPQPTRRAPVSSCLQ